VKVSAATTAIGTAGGDAAGDCNRARASKNRLALGGARFNLAGGGATLS
jgi:hypothetical protein